MIPPKYCQTYEEAKEYLLGYGIYVWESDQDLDLVKYLLNIGIRIYVARRHRSRDVSYVIISNINQIYMRQWKLLHRPIKVIKFVRKGFMNYVKEFYNFKYDF